MLYVVSSLQEQAKEEKGGIKHDAGRNARERKEKEVKMEDTWYNYLIYP